MNQTNTRKDYIFKMKFNKFLFAAAIFMTIVFVSGCITLVRYDNDKNSSSQTIATTGVREDVNIAIANIKDEIKVEEPVKHEIATTRTKENVKVKNEVELPVKESVEQNEHKDRVKHEEQVKVKVAKKNETTQAETTKEETTKVETTKVEAIQEETVATTKGVEETVTGEEIAYVELDAPKTDTIKTYMSYRAITSKSSRQYKLQNSLAYTDDNGLRMVNGRYCVALGSYYTTTIGQWVDIELENGEVIHGILADGKSDKHTDETNRICFDGSVVEFVVDTKTLDKTAKKMGDISYLNNWNSKVNSIKVYDKVEVFE